jgi:hypothetical protein
MTTRMGPSDPAIPWSVLMLTPSGYVEVVEVRAPTEAQALDTVRSWKPYHRVAVDRRGNPLVSRGAVSSGEAMATPRCPGRVSSA